MDNISMVKFSSRLYKEYKEFEKKLDDFEQFIIEKINMGGVGSLIKALKKEIKFDETLYSKMKIDKSVFNTYIKRLKGIFNGKENELEEIVKIYLFILENKKKSLSYINSHADELKKQFKICISNSLEFFNKKQFFEFQSIIKKSFYDIDQFSRIVKERIKNPDNSKIKDINIDKIESNIRNNATLTQKKFEDTIKNYWADIDRRISQYRNCSEDGFRSLVSRNNDELSYFVQKIQSIKNEFESFLTKHKNEVDKICKLEEFEKDKKEMEKNMKKFEKLYKGNYCISASSNISKDSHRFLFWTWKTFNSERSLRYYQNDVDKYFKDCRSDNIKRINTDAINCIDDIKKILYLYTTGIQKFEENKDLFDERIEDIRNYTNELFGIKI